MLFSKSLEESGWELVTPSPGLQTTLETKDFREGDLVSVQIAVINPDEFEKPSRSVVLHRFWVEIVKQEVHGYIGVLKTQSEHSFKVKDGSSFIKGQQIYFERKHIFTSKSYGQKK